MDIRYACRLADMRNLVIVHDSRDRFTVCTYAF